MGNDTPLHETKTGMAVGDATATGDLAAVRSTFWTWWIENDLDQVCVRFMPRWVHQSPTSEDLKRDILSFVMDKSLRYVESKGHVPSFGELKQMVKWETPDVAKAQMRSDPTAVIERVQHGEEDRDEREERRSRMDAPIGAPGGAAEVDVIPGGSFANPADAASDAAYWDLVRELPDDPRADYRRAGRLLARLLEDPTIKRTKVDEAEGWSEQQGKNAMAALKKIFIERFGE